MVGTLFLALAVAAPARAELSENDGRFLKSVQQRLDQAKSNLKLAAESAGPADKQPSPSKARLALTRSGQAKAQLESVNDAAAKLPADEPEVEKLLTDAKETGEAIAALEARLTGKPGGAMKDGDAPAGKKLDYKQRELLKNAQFYMSQSEGQLAALEKVAAQVKAAKSPDELDAGLLKRAMATVAEARDRRKSLDAYFADLPADGAGVAAAIKSADETMAGIEAAGKVIAPHHARMAKLVDPGSYPALEEDVERVQGLAKMLGDPNVLRNDPARAAEIVMQLPAARREHARVTKAYAALAQRDTEAGKRVTAATRFFAEREKSFAEAMARRAKELPSEIRADLDQVTKTAEEAVAEKKPLYFTGGIPQQLGFAESKLPLLAALDPRAAAPLEKALEDARQDVQQKQASLRDLIIAQNDLPPDKYAGPDKAALAARATAAWKKVQPDAEVLAVRFPSEKWKRETKWELQNTTFYKVDRSRLQAQVVVRHDDKLAVVRAVNLWTDHVDADALSAIPLDADAAGELDPQSVLLIEKVK
jgi:hypothetical protein